MVKEIDGRLDDADEQRVDYLNKAWEEKCQEIEDYQNSLDAFGNPPAEEEPDWDYYMKQGPVPDEDGNWPFRVVKGYGRYWVNNEAMVAMISDKETQKGFSIVMYILCHADDNGFCFSTQSQMAKDLKKDKSRVSILMKMLIRRGVVLKGDPNKSTSFKVNMFYTSTNNVIDFNKNNL